MSKKKGLSADEKKSRLLDLFHEKKDVFLLKELEKIAPKEKGIVSQSVKEVLNVLVSEDLVETEKIGSSVYFWSFPSKAINSKIHKIVEMKEKMCKTKISIKRLDSELKKYEISESEAKIKEKALKELNSLKERRDKLKTRLEQMRDKDPKRLEEMKSDCELSKEAISRWTDNVLSVKSWCKQKFFIEDSEINKQFGIPEDFDCLEFED